MWRLIFFLMASQAFAQDPITRDKGTTIITDSTETDTVDVTGAGGAHVNLRDASGNELGTSFTNPVRAVLPAQISAANSTTTPLSGGATFTGAWEDGFGVSTIALSVFSSHDSAIRGLKIQQSVDGTTVGPSDEFTIYAMTTPGQDKVYSVGVNARYFRVVYTNGATLQTAFRLQTVAHYMAIKSSSHRVGDTIVEDDDAELVKSVITGSIPGSRNYANVRVDDTGNLLVRPVASFASGSVFGEVATSAIAVFPCRKTTYTEQTVNAQRSFSSSSANDAAAGTGARTLELTYLNALGEGPFQETIALNGTACVSTVASNIAYIEDMDVHTVGATGANEGTISLFVNAACGGGTIGTVAVGDGTTLWAHHYVPTGIRANITALAGANTASTLSNSGRFFLRAKQILVANAIDEQISGQMRFFAQTSEVARTFGSPVQVIGPARITAYANLEGGGSVTNYCSFDFYNEEIVQ